MKAIHIPLLLGLSLSAYLLFLVSCTLRNTRPLTGKWQVIFLKDEYSDVDVRNKIVREEEKLFAQFINESTYIIQSPDRIDTFNYRTDQDKILFQNDKFVYTYKVTKDSLFLNGVDTKHQSILIRVK